jgi:hypothetical protein
VEKNSESAALLLSADRIKIRLTELNMVICGLNRPQTTFAQMMQSKDC